MTQVILDRPLGMVYTGGTTTETEFVMDRTGLPSDAMRDVRVTAKVSTPRDFIAPDLSPVSTHAVEMDKGLRGFTDMEKKLVTVVTSPAAERVKRQMRDVKDMKAGTRVIRREASSDKTVVKTTGPSARFREAQLRAARLAALEGTLDNW